MENSLVNKKEIVNMKKWITCLCIVCFDIEHGQAIEEIFPQNVLEKSEEKLLSLLAFPDSNNFASTEGYLQYIIKIQRNNQNEKNNEIFFGFVYFLQKKDSSINRGYYQKSIVLLTKNPILSFYKSFIQRLGELYFSIKKPVNFLEVNNFFRFLSTKNFQFL